MGRRLRGLSLGFLILAVNILLVAGLVFATSAEGLLDLGIDETSTQPVSASGSPRMAPSEGTPTSAADPVAYLKQRFKAGDPLNVVVLGDQTGTHQNDWVQAWAGSLAAVRPIELQVPSAADPTRYPPPVKVGTTRPAPGNGLIGIRNASIVGSTPSYVAPRVPLFVPVDTDVVLLNFGRSNTPGDITVELSKLHSALAEEVPDADVRVIVQPPRQDGQPQLDRSVRTWAEGARVGTIDVAAEFSREGIILDTVSARDPLSVNILGGQVWASIVQNALFGPLTDNGDRVTASTPVDAESIAAEPPPRAVIPQQPVATVAPRPQPQRSTPTPTATSTEDPPSPAPTTDPEPALPDPEPTDTEQPPVDDGGAS